ncbi:RimK family alpha-L-glutamate ligase [Embleya sp. NPDC020630]|uniref:RimK family alpha-L-glutamate ligase n=1 Tax=Embleya sp. NPDC020630 TaxID=3363979 RepID=UPI0037A6B337
MTDGTDAVAADVWILDRPDGTDRTGTPWETTALSAELTGRGLRVEAVDWAGLTPSCVPAGVLREDGRFEVPRLAVVCSRVLTRHPSGHLADELAWLGLLADAGTRLVNPVGSLGAYDNKVRQIAALASAGLPVPDTRVARTPEDVDACLGAWQDVVVKPPYGHASVDVLRLRAAGSDSPHPGGLGTRPGILVWHLLERHRALCVQRFVTNPGRDLRVVVIGSRVVACYFHVNTAPDGNTHHPLYPHGWAAAELPPRVEKLALRASATLGLDVASVDLLEGPDGPVIIEVNPSISRWRSIEGTEHDRSPHGITHAYADLLCGLLCA